MNEGTIQKIFNNIMAATSQLYGLSYIIGLLYLTFLKIISYIKFCVPQSPPAGGGVFGSLFVGYVPLASQSL